jgi:hypothetical protein
MVWGVVDERARLRAPRAVAVVIAVPGTVMALLFAANAILRGHGNALIWPIEALTLAEALVHRNPGEVAYQISRGIDVNQPSLLARGSPARRPVMVMPLEAAVLSGEVGFVALLLEHGAAMDRRNLMTLRCLADRIGEQYIERFLAARDDRPLDCHGVAPGWHDR